VAPLGAGAEAKQRAGRPGEDPLPGPAQVAVRGPHLGAVFRGVLLPLLLGLLAACAPNFQDRHQDRGRGREGIDDRLPFGLVEGDPGEPRDREAVVAVVADAGRPDLCPWQDRGMLEAEVPLVAHRRPVLAAQGLRAEAVVADTAPEVVVAGEDGGEVAPRLVAGRDGLSPAVNGDRPVAGGVGVARHDAKVRRAPRKGKAGFPGG